MKNLQCTEKVSSSLNITVNGTVSGMLKVCRGILVGGANSAIMIYFAAIRKCTLGKIPYSPGSKFFLLVV